MKFELYLSFNLTKIKLYITLLKLCKKYILYNMKISCENLNYI